MNNNELISIIVPIYNNEKFLSKCLESLVNQTYKNFEIVLVNDGSTDDSEKICKEYCKKYNNIHYFFKKNTGVSDTRNFGIKKSKGTYITFVDSDDYIDLNFLEKLSKYIVEGYEMITCNHIEEFKDKQIKIGLADNDCDITCPTFLDSYFNTYCLSTACKTLFKKSLIEKNNIVFDSNLNYGEDMLFSIRSYVNSNKTYYLNYSGYYYYMNEQSSSHINDINKIKKQCNDYLILYDTIKELLEEKNIEYNYNVFLDGLLKNYVGSISRLFLHNDREKYKYINEVTCNYNDYLKEYRILKSKLSLKYKLQIILLKLKKYRIFNFLKKI